MGGLGIGITPHEILQTVSLGGGPPPWTPADHPSTKVWLDASQITGLVDGNPVPLWEDLIGTIVGFNQATAAKRPTYRTGVLNGLPVVRFDGTDDYLHATAEFLSFQDPTLWVVFKGNTTGGQYIFADYGDSQKAFVQYLNAGTVHSFIRSSGSKSITVSNGSATSFVITAMVTQTAIDTLRLFRNEAEANNTNPDYTPTTWEGYYLDFPTLGAFPGGSSVLNGDVGEVIICDNLDAADRALFWTYLNNKWAVY